MRRTRPEYLDPKTSDRWVAADVLVREEPDEEEDEEGDGEEKEGEEEDDDEGYSECARWFVLASCLESIATTSQDRRRLLSEARAAPRLMSGTTINSSTVTSESSTWYSSTSRTVSGGLKFHCWRTMSRNERPPSGDHRKTNSWVRFIAVSSKTSAMRVSLCG